MSQAAISFDALAIEREGGPVRRITRTIDEVADDALVVRVAYASINKMDPALAQRNVFSLPAPYVLGFDFSGEVVRAGAATSHRAGDQVFGRRQSGGCFAEMLVADPAHVLPRGPIPAAEASTYGIAYLTAYESLIITGRIQDRAGATIFIPGGGGGLGHFAVQLAHLHGLRVIASAGKPASIALLRQLGVEDIIDYTSQDVVAEVLRRTGGKGADLVYDATYTQASYDRSAAVIAAGGDYLRLGTLFQLGQRDARDMTPEVEARGARLVETDLGRYQRDPAFLARVPEVIEGQRRAIAWYEQGKLRPVITATVPFDATALQHALEAHGAGASNVGKVVVRCAAG